MTKNSILAMNSPKQQSVEVSALLSMHASIHKTVGVQKKKDKGQKRVKTEVSEHKVPECVFDVRALLHMLNENQTIHQAPKM